MGWAARAACAGTADPLHRTVELNVGDTAEVELSNGGEATVKLLDVQESRDALRGAIRQATVKLEVNGQAVTLVSANYRLPVTIAGVQIDCPATKGLYVNCDPWEDSWGLDKDARLRLWPDGSPWLPKGTLVYPVKQRWFASGTQMANEPAFVDGGDAPNGRPIYYHNGLDIGGCEGLVDVMAATEGVVVSAGKDVLPGFPDPPVAPRYDVVYIRDARDWYYRYSHLRAIYVKPGDVVRSNQVIGVLGKEGSSGGWSHLHFDIKSKQPSGKWGTEEAYAFLWEAYLSDYPTPLIAVARPHHLTWTGETVLLDGSRSWSARNRAKTFQWTLSDGRTAEGDRVERAYERPGTYSEILKVTDSEGNVDYDFQVVQVIDKANPDRLPPTIHASYAPTYAIRAGDFVTFKVRTFRAKAGNETWDFGDGSARVLVHSDANADPSALGGYAQAVHHYDKPGHYLVRVEGQGDDGSTATAHLAVRVGEPIAKRGAFSFGDTFGREILGVQEAQSMMATFLEKELQPLPLPESQQSWLDRRDALRHEVLGVLGIDDLVPPKWDLAVQSKGTLERDGYKIEKITFQSYPGLTIPALVYVPDRTEGRGPGIVSISGHTAISKAAEYVQQRNVNLALRGCVVLSYDYLGYGERMTGDDKQRPTEANAHGIRSFSYSGRTATALEVLDGIRAVDVLVARADVDQERIGFTGESGGGNSTYWMAAVDPRVKLAVPVSSVTTFDYWIRTDRNWDWHQRPTGIRRIADIGTLLALHAPNPLLIISSHRGTDDDEFPLEEAEKSYQWAKHVYGLLDAENAVGHYESSTAHGYQEDKREQLYVAVEKWLQPPNAQGGKELPVKVEAIDDLRAGPPEHNRTFRDVYAEWVKPLPAKSDAVDSDDLRAFLLKRLGWPDPLPDVKAEKVGREEMGALFAEFWIFEPEPGIRLPAVWAGQKGAYAPITLVPGRDEHAIVRALLAGRQVLAFDPRGTGEMLHGEGGFWPSIAGPPWPTLLGDAGKSMSNWAWFVGRPWPGMWALDLVQGARFCDQLSSGEVYVDAENDFGWSALLAGAAAPDLIPFGRVLIPRASLQDDVRERGDRALADVPGLLERLDVPQLQMLWPKGKVSIR